MKAVALFFSLLLLVFAPVWGQDAEPLISIESPDQETTYAHSSIKEHSLIWNKRTQQLLAHLVFTDDNGEGTLTPDDAMDFRLPGVTFDQAKGIFYATSAKGEIIPVAKIRKQLFFRTIETLPNAVVRIRRTHGNVAVVLEAISPNDPAMHDPTPDDSDSDQTHAVDIHQIIN